VISLIGIYDGFGGTEAAEYISRRLHVNLLRNENLRHSPYMAISEAFYFTNEGFMKTSQNKRLPDVVGCSAVLCMIRGEELWISWLGDCQAVLVRAGGQVINPCESHTPYNEAERERIEGLGGSIQEKGGQLRLGGIYPITRAFGCSRMKKYMTAEPEIVAFDIQEGEQFLVLFFFSFMCFLRFNPSLPSSLFRKKR